MKMFFKNEHLNGIFILVVFWAKEALSNESSNTLCNSTQQDFCFITNGKLKK